MLVLEGLGGLHGTVQLFSISGRGIDLDYCDIEWFALEKFGRQQIWKTQQWPQD